MVGSPDRFICVLCLGSHKAEMGVSQVDLLTKGSGEESASKTIYIVGKVWFPVVAGLRSLIPC